MRWFNKLFHPLATFIGIQVIWVLMVVLWVYWFVGHHKEFRALAELYRPELAGRLNWIVLTEGLVLLVSILAGVYILFLVWRKQSTLYNQQKNFISQLTHELKSPLASIQLHLETIRLRNPPPDKMERFLDTMLADADRLNNLINNLLMAARLEKRRKPSQYPIIDFSAFVVQYFEKKRLKLPEGGSLKVEAEEGIKIAADTDGMEIVLRNLFENAVLYSAASPDIRVRLERDDKSCRLTFRDRGIGLDRKQLKKIFKMFYRVRSQGENIRGSGLGLHIVKSVISEHNGKVVATSEGYGKGSTFTICLPLADTHTRGNDD